VPGTRVLPRRRRSQRPAVGRTDPPDRAAGETSSEPLPVEQ